MVKTFRAVCKYEDGSEDQAKVSITSEGGKIYQVAWQISNGETGRSVEEAGSVEEVFERWCEDNEFEPSQN